MYFVRQPIRLLVPLSVCFLKFCATQMHPFKMSFTCNTLSSVLIVFWHELGGKVKQEIGVASYEFRYTSSDIRFRIFELRGRIHKLRD